MIPSIAKDGPEDCSSIQVSIHIQESWIANLVSRDELVISVGDQYQLHHLRFKMGKDKLTVLAEIVGKPGSFVEVTCSPHWDPGQQKLLLRDLQFQTRTRNLFVKSAAWFATTFMQEKIDKRIEEYTHLLYQHHLDRLKTGLMEIPIPGNGMAKAQIDAIYIEDMKFEDGVSMLKATIEGKWEVMLKGAD